jgi:uncharacterized protein (DUF2384 family)
MSLRRNTDRRIRLRLHRKKNLPSRLSQGERVSSMAMRTFGSKENSERWFKTPLAQFEGRTPKQMLTTKIGARELELLLLRMISAVAA